MQADSLDTLRDADSAPNKVAEINGPAIEARIVDPLDTLDGVSLDFARLDSLIEAADGKCLSALSGTVSAASEAELWHARNLLAIAQQQIALISGKVDAAHGSLLRSGRCSLMEEAA